MDAVQVDNAIAHGYQATWQSILQNNPNVELIYLKIQDGKVIESGSLFGSAAADFLNGIYNGLKSGKYKREKVTVTVTEADDGGDPQNPPYTDTQAKCDQKLAQIFGGENAVAAGNNYEPPGMFRDPNYRLYRGGPGGEFTDMMHLYGNNTGTAVTGVYVPGNYTAVYPNPRAKATDVGGSFVFFYANLNGYRNVSLVATHVANFDIDRSDTNAAGSIRIGDIGGPGGDSSDLNPSHPYIHAHLSLLQGRVTAKRSLASMKKIAFPRAFCK